MNTTQHTSNPRPFVPAGVLLLVLPLLLSSHTRQSSPRIAAAAELATHIVQGWSYSAALAAVRELDAEVTHELPIIQAVAARLSPEQADSLGSDPSIRRVHENAEAGVAGGKAPVTHYPTLVGANELHDEGITGHGVTVAVIDTGYFSQKGLNENSLGASRILAQYDAIEDSIPHSNNSTDDSGHGAHVAAVAANSETSKGTDDFAGIAPDADLVVVKAFGADGQGTYADVIRGLDWIVSHRDAYGIRVLNLSFCAAPRSHYWDDPMNQAVMRAWQAGIVVVAAAGNEGPSPMRVGVPGNVPYVITVGAMSDADTPEEPADDFLASFSAAGPTTEGFLKPELVAPGGHMISLMGSDTELSSTHPEYRIKGSYFMMSGTSQATAVVSGIAALMLEADPALTPDDLKCRLLFTARPATEEGGGLAYSPFQQGAGLADAWAAVHGEETGCANGGLDIDADLDQSDHYFGPARLNGDGHFTIEGSDYTWDGSYDGGSGHAWDGGNPWNDATTWDGGIPWIEARALSTGNPWVDIGGNPWVDVGGNPWVDAAWWGTSGSFSATLTESMSINIWVPQE